MDQVDRCCNGKLKYYRVCGQKMGNIREQKKTATNVARDYKRIDNTL